MEHLSTFGLDRDPFGCDAQLAWYFEGVAFGDATRRLHRAALQNKGLCVVTGRGGVGKTMLVRHLLQALEDEVFEASMLVPVPGITDMRWLLTRWAQQLGVEAPSSEIATVLAQVYEQLAIVREDGRSAVLILDEAQVLAERGLLADLRGLLNLEYEEKRLVTLVLVGSPAVADAVANEPALNERVDLRLVLPPLQPKEVVGYLHHRIRVAGGNPAILESAAVAALTRLGAGIPRRINALADNALFEAHVAGRVSATGVDVERAAAEVDLGGTLAVPAATRATVSPARSVEAPRTAERTAAAQPPQKRRESINSDDLLGGADVELELGEVVAEPTGRRAAPAPPAASAYLGEARSSRGRGDDLSFQVSREQLPPDLDDANELEDLFADIVDE